MTSQIVPVAKEIAVPWKNFISRPTDQSVFYFVSPELHTSKESITSFYLYSDKVLKEITAYTNPIAGIICQAQFEMFKEGQLVWLVKGDPDEGVRSIEGRVQMREATIIKRTNFKLTMSDAFKLAGAATMRVHDDKTFLGWFLDSLGDRTSNSITNMELSRYSRNISERYKDDAVDKSYEYLAVAHLAEFKESKEQEWSRRKKLACAFMYAIHAANLREKEIDVQDLCEKTLTLIRPEEKIALPVKPEIDWTGYGDSGDCDSFK